MAALQRLRLRTRKLQMSRSAARQLREGRLHRLVELPAQKIQRIQSPAECQSEGSDPQVKRYFQGCSRCHDDPFVVVSQNIDIKHDTAARVILHSFARDIWVVA